MRWLSIGIYENIKIVNQNTTLRIYVTTKQRAVAIHYSLSGLCVTSLQFRFLALAKRLVHILAYLK